MTDMKIKVFEAFAGYGSQHIALKRLAKDYLEFSCEVVGISEIDKNPILAYNALHPGVHNYGDISQIDWHQVPDFDLFTYSFPCQQLSKAGQQKGMKKGSNTTSSLVWDCLKAITIKSPKWLLMENVPDVLSDKHRADFDEWRLELEKLGYENHISILRSQDFGVPQSRSRAFMVSILGGGGYFFPTKIGCDRRLKDIIEYDVAEKYYKNDKLLDKIPLSARSAETICLNKKVNGKKKKTRPWKKYPETCDIL